MLQAVRLSGSLASDLREISATPCPKISDTTYFKHV